MIFRAAVIAIFALSPIACERPVNSEDRSPEDQLIIAAESFVDAFYSFDPDVLLTALSSAEDSIPSILFYQGWAEGGNYEILERLPCKVEDAGKVSCSITVKDDLIGALGIELNVTDTFHLSFQDGQIVSVNNSSNDPKAYYEAQQWVEENRPELIEKPCTNFFDGGLTPGDCVRAMVQGYSEFVAITGFSEGSKSPD